MSVLLAVYIPEAYLPYPREIVWQLVLAIFILTTVFPSLIVFSLWMYTPIVSDLELTDRKERLVPFLVLITCYSVTAYFLILGLEMGWIVQVMLLSGILLIVLMLVINTRFKISIHSACIWALVGYSLGLCLRFGLNDMLPVVWGGILVGGLIATSRLHLGYHKPSEVWLGTLLGFSFSFLTVLLVI